MSGSIASHPVGALDQAVARVLNELHTGLKHGYFEFTLTCEVIGNGRRRLQVHAGKNYQFVIPADECHTAGAASDLPNEGASSFRS
jgi:hypothetical protein